MDKMMTSEQIKNLITDKISGEWGEEAILGEGVRIIRTANFTNLGVINYDKVVYRNVDEKKVNQKKLKKGDIIIEKSGGSPNQPVGRVVYFDLDTQENYLCNNFTTILRPDKNKVYPKYLFYQLFIGHIKGKTLKYQNKTTGIINLKLDSYLNERINISPLEDQIRIATILSKVEALIKQRKESIALLDEFLKSTFLDMFGEKADNDYNVFTLNELKSGGNETFSNGPFGSDLLTSELTDSGTPVIYVRDIRNGYFKWKSDVFITKSKALSLSNCKVIGNDLLIAKIGDPPGITAVYPLSLNEAIITQDVIRLRLNENLVLPNWLTYYLNSEIGKAAIKQITISGTRNRFSLGDFKKIKVKTPSLIIQAQFAQIVEKTEALKKQYQVSLEELEQLFGSLSQEVFKGGLDLSQVEIEEEENFETGFVTQEEVKLPLEIYEKEVIAYFNGEPPVKSSKKAVISKINDLEFQKIQLGHEDSSKHKALIQYFEKNESINFSDLYRLNAFKNAYYL